MHLELRLEPAHQRIDHYTFDEHGGYIGSDPECHWILEGGGHRIAKRLALISFDEELFWLSDDSPDGILHNDSRVPIGKGNRVPVKDGDRFYMAGLQVVAQLIGGVEAQAVSRDSRALDSAVGFEKLSRATPTIPHDWMDVPAPQQAAEYDVPALVTARRLSSMQEAASKAFLQNLLPNTARSRDDIDVEGAAILGKAMRACIDIVLQLRDEYADVERAITGAPALNEERSASVDFCQRLIDESEREAALEEWIALATALPGRHSALRLGALDGLAATLNLYQPTAIEQRFAKFCKAPRPGSGMTVSFGDRLVRNSGLWKFYVAWQQQLQAQGAQRADQRVFDKALLMTLLQRSPASAASGAEQQGGVL